MLTNIESVATTSAADAVVPSSLSSGPAASKPTLALKEREITGEKPRILDEAIIEEVSIDGMCGVY